MQNKQVDERWTKIIELLKDEAISTILDLGCGKGEFFNLLSKEIEKYGIDIIKQKPLHFNYKKADLEKAIPFPDNFFDAITGADVLEHIHDTNNLIEECRRTLKKGGILVLATPNLGSIENIIRLILTRQPLYVAADEDKGEMLYQHVRAYSAESLLKQLERHNFKVEELASHKMPLPLIRNIPFIRRIQWILPQIFPKYSGALIVKARKI